VAVAHQWNPEDKEHAGPPGTYMEHADEVFQNVGHGIIGGAVVPIRNDKGEVTWYNHGMDAETLVKRCKFIRCSEAGLVINSFNALDWWVWDSEFVDCAVGATNCAEGEYGGGHFHLYRCLFRGSKVADIRTGHCSYFGFRFNTSIGSRRFLETIRPKGYSGGPGMPTLGAWKDSDTFGSPQAFQGNRIINPTDPTPVFVNQHGPLTLVDNVFAVKPGSDQPVVRVAPPTDGARCISIGNRFFGADRVEVKGELTAFDNETLDYAKADLSVPTLPAFAPRVERKVFQLAAGATGEEIQKAIDEAAKLAGQKPVVHLPAGRYPVQKTLTVPALADVQIIGDGTETCLIWEGEDEGTMLRLAGPARATLRDFRIAGVWSPKRIGRGIVADNLDQPGGQVLLDQATESNSPKSGFLFAGLSHTRVEARGFQGRLRVEGVGDAKSSRTVAVFGGCVGYPTVAKGGGLVITESWSESNLDMARQGLENQYIHLTDRGNLTLWNGTIAQVQTTNPNIELDGFAGRFALIGVGVNHQAKEGLQLRVAGARPELQALILGSGFTDPDPWFENETKVGQVAVLACFRNNQTIPTIGQPTPEFLREMLKDARTVVPTDWQPAPEGATDLRLHRVTAYERIAEGMIFRGAAEK